MENPGLTIFQGGESIKIDTSISRLEEEEALEDQKRRNEELGNQLQFAFDDLIDEDENTIDSSTYFQPHLPTEIKDSINQNKEVLLVNGQTTLESEKENENIQNGQRKKGQIDDHNAHRDDIYRLEKMIESKQREVENLSKLILDERKKNDELKKRLVLSEAEKERANMSKQQTHELLVESKTQISELEDTVMRLKSKVATLEDANNNLIDESEKMKTMLVDCQQKYHLVEKNAAHQSDKNTDAIIKQVNERHMAQIQIMQHQINNLMQKVEDKENELRTLDTKYKDLQRSHESLLVEKAETINQLARSLEDSQKQCQNLMKKQDFAQENIRLQRLVKALERQTDDMEKTINNLTARLQTTTAELELMDSVLCENDLESPHRFSPTKGNLVGSTPLNVSDRLSKLKNELYRSMAAQKNKREEIRRLQEQLSSKNEEIRRIKDEENKVLVEITTYKENNIRLESKLKALESELNKKKAEASKDIQEDLKQQIMELNKKNEIINSDLQFTKKEYKDLQESSQQLKEDIEKLQTKLKGYENVEKEKEDLVLKLKDLSNELEKIRKEYDDLKVFHETLSNGDDWLQKGTEIPDVFSVQLEKYKFLLKDSQNECNRLKSMYVEVSDAKEALRAELEAIKSEEMNVELKKLEEKCAHIEKALSLSELKCSEWQKLLEVQKTSFEKEINELKTELEKEKSKKDSVNNCTKCLDNLEKITKHELENLKLQTQCTEQLKLQIDLQNRLREAEDTIKELTHKLNLNTESDQIISELKIKAQQFEEFIRNQSNSNSRSSEISSSKQNQVQLLDKSVETSSDLENGYSRRSIESEIRNEMAKMFAHEIKQIERKFQYNIASLEKQNSHLLNDMHKINSELKQRQKEVEVLKHAILSERQKMQEILNNNQEESKIVIQKHTVMLNKCRNELQSKTEQMEAIIKEMNERNSQIESERQSMKVVMTQWEEQRKNHDDQMGKWKQLLEEHEKVVEQLQSKYNSVKKTAANYKKYAEDKEKHMLMEYERIKSEYEESLNKIEKKMKEILEKKEFETKERIREIETSYGAKLDQFQKQLGQNKIN